MPENWENHLDLLEDEITGPLYKTVLERPALSGWSEKLVTGPLSVSVSKINQWVSVFVLVVWISLSTYPAYKTLTALNISSRDWVVLCAYIFIAIIAFLCCLCMLKKGRTDKGDYLAKPIERKTRIGDRL